MTKGKSIELEGVRPSRTSGRTHCPSPWLTDTFYLCFFSTNIGIIVSKTNVQCSLLLKELHMRPYILTKRRCICNKKFRLGPIVWKKIISRFISQLFIMFRVYVSWPQKLVMFRNMSINISKFLQFS